MPGLDRGKGMLVPVQHLGQADQQRRLGVRVEAAIREIEPVFGRGGSVVAFHLVANRPQHGGGRFSRPAVVECDVPHEEQRFVIVRVLAEKLGQSFIRLVVSAGQSRSVDLLEQGVGDALGLSTRPTDRTGCARAEQRDGELAQQTEREAPADGPVGSPLVADEDHRLLEPGGHGPLVPAVRGQDQEEHSRNEHEGVDRLLPGRAQADQECPEERSHDTRHSDEGREKIRIADSKGRRRSRTRQQHEDGEAAASPGGLEVEAEDQQQKQRAHEVQRVLVEIDVRDEGQRVEFRRAKSPALHGKSRDAGERLLDELVELLLLPLLDALRDRRRPAANPAHALGLPLELDEAPVDAFD
jgi:hypothetical protein